MSRPQISIVTPNYNGAETLAETIRSVLEPGVEELEYVVVDGGSTDESPQILKRLGKRYGDRLLWERLGRNGGQYAAIMRGFSQTSGEIMGWLNSDDRYHPWTLRTVVEIFNRFPNVDWIMGLPTKMQDGAIHEVSVLRPWPQVWLRLGLFFGDRFGVVQQESCFWRRHLWERAGGLDIQWKYAADFELWTRFARHAELYACAMVLGGFSITGKNRSILHKAAYDEEVKKIVMSLDERERYERNRIIQAVYRFDQVKRVPWVRRLAAGRVGVADAPVILRDFQAHDYWIERWKFPLA